MAGQCRLSRRRFKLANGEQSDDHSGSDPDSGNDESLKTKKKRRVEMDCFGDFHPVSDDCSDEDREESW